MAVLGLAGPLWGANVLTLTCTDAGSSQCLITYTVTQDPCVPAAPAAMAIKITMTNGFTVDSPCDVLEMNPEYNTFIDFIYDMAEPNSYDPENPQGDPLADPTGPGYANLPSSVISVCMGRLTDPPSGASLSGTVIKLQLHDNGASSALMTVEADPLRGGVAGDVDGSEFTVVSGNCGYWHPIPCWGYACFPCGDADGSGTIAPADALILLDAWPPKPYDSCGDFDKSGAISPADALRILDHWPPKEACPAADGCQ